MSQATIDPNLLNNILSVNYIYGPVISGGPSEFQAQVNLKNIHTLEVDTLVYSNIDFGDASGNLYVGSNSGKFAINNSNTTGLGEESLYGQVSNSNVTAVGYGAMGSNTEENTYVVAVGTNAGISMFNTSDSVVIGDSAGQSLSSATGMVFVGTNAGQNTTQAECDIFIGRNAGFNNTTGCNNVFMGCDAGYINTTGTGNVFLGYNAGSNVAYATSNNHLLIANNATSNLITGDFASGWMGVGFAAGYTNTGVDKLLVSGQAMSLRPAGYGAFRIATTAGPSPNGDTYLQPAPSPTVGSQANLYIGQWGTGVANFAFLSTGSMGVNTSAPQYTLDVSGMGNFTSNLSVSGKMSLTDSLSNILVGFNAGLVNAGVCNTFVGYGAGQSNNIGSNNTHIGYQAGFSNVTGSENTCVGWLAGFSNVGFSNTYIGAAAGLNISLGASENVLVGNSAARDMISGSFNTILGADAASNISAAWSIVAIGALCATNASGSLCNSIYIGGQAGRSNSNGCNNVMIGPFAGSNSSGVSNCVIVGANAGRNLSGGSGNVFIGSNAGSNVSDGVCNVFLGINAGASNVYTGSSNLLIIANNSNSNLIVGNFSNGQVGIHMPAGVSPSYTLHVSGPTWSWNTPRAFGYVEGTTLPATLCNSFNISSISDQNILGATLYTISFLVSMPDTNYTIQVTPTARAVPVIIKNAGSFTVDFNDLTNTPTTTDFSFVVHWNGNM